MKVKSQLVEDRKIQLHLSWQLPGLATRLPVMSGL